MKNLNPRRSRETQEDCQDPHDPLTKDINPAEEGPRNPTVRPSIGSTNFQRGLPLPEHVNQH